jgi:hypothetical protein
LSLKNLIFIRFHLTICGAAVKVFDPGLNVTEKVSEIGKRPPGKLKRINGKPGTAIGRLRLFFTPIRRSFDPTGHKSGSRKAIRVDKPIYQYSIS